MHEKSKILWADDEITMLKPHILYLEEKGYEVTPVNSGEDAIQLCDEKKFDVVDFLVFRCPYSCQLPFVRPHLASAHSTVILELYSCINQARIQFYDGGNQHIL